MVSPFQAGDHKAQISKRQKYRKKFPGGKELIYVQVFRICLENCLTKTTSSWFFLTKPQLKTPLELIASACAKELTSTEPWAFCIVFNHSRCRLESSLKNSKFIINLICAPCQNIHQRRWQMTELGQVPLGDATYLTEISRLYVYVLWFQTRRLFYVFSK